MRCCGRHVECPERAPAAIPKEEVPRNGHRQRSCRRRRRIRGATCWRERRGGAGVGGGKARPLELAEQNRKGAREAGAQCRFEGPTQRQDAQALLRGRPRRVSAPTKDRQRKGIERGGLGAAVGRRIAWAADGGSPSRLAGRGVDAAPLRQEAAIAGHKPADEGSGRVGSAAIVGRQGWRRRRKEAQSELREERNRHTLEFAQSLLVTFHPFIGRDFGFLPMQAISLVGGRSAAPSGGAAAAAQSTLSMYRNPPNELVTLEDFEVFAFERLKGERWLFALSRQRFW